MSRQEGVGTGAEPGPVKNATAWMAAFGPLVSSILAGMMGRLVWGDPANWLGWPIFFLVLFRILLVYRFLQQDEKSLKKQGFDPKALGIVAPWNLPVYLFSRAKAFGQTKAYALTWCAFAGFEVFGAIWRAMQ